MVLNLQNKLKELSQKKEVVFQAVETVLNHKLTPEFPKLASFLCTPQLEKSTLYKVLQPQIQAVTNGYEYGSFADAELEIDKSFYRAILWHLEHGENFSAILETLRNRALVSRADIYFFPGVDIGTWRSKNINVIRDLAIELGYNYYFATSYLHLDWSHTKTTSYLGLEGNAIMSRFPLSNLRMIPLTNFRDPMKGSCKRLGCEKAVLADVKIGTSLLTLVCVNLPENSSQRERLHHMNTIMSAVHAEYHAQPILMGGDLKTSTYNCKTPLRFFFSAFNKVYRDFDYVVEEHFTYPERYFERQLFQVLAQHGFSIDVFNEMGVGTYHNKALALMEQGKQSVLAKKLAEILLKEHTGKVSFKYDWFAANSKVRVSQRHEAERPKVIQHLFKEGIPISNHDPVLLDFEVAAEMMG